MEVMGAVMPMKVPLLNPALVKTLMLGQEKLNRYISVLMELMESLKPEKFLVSKTLRISRETMTG